MPCRDYEPPWGKGHPDYDKIDNLTRMLCGLCKEVEKGQESNQRYINRVPGLAKWWDAHKEQDRKREAAERAEKKRVMEREILQLKELQKKYPKV